MTDYPDWQAAPATQSPNQFPALTQNLAPGAHPTAITPVYSWESCSLIVVPSAGACKVTLSHYADQAGTMLIGADTWNTNPATTLTVRVPLRGPYAQLSVNVTSPGNLTAETWGVYQTQAADRISFPVSGRLIFEPFRTLAPGAQALYTMPAIVAGLANWCYVPFDNAGAVNPYVQIVDELGNILARVSDRGFPVTYDNALIALPDQILQVLVTNTDGAANHTYGFSLIAPPR